MSLRRRSIGPISQQPWPTINHVRYSWRLYDIAMTDQGFVSLEFGRSLRLTRNRDGLRTHPSIFTLLPTLVFLFLEIDGAYFLLVLTKLFTGTPASKSQDVVGRYSRKNTGSDDFVSAIRSWLDSCLKHQLCNKTMSSS